MRILAVIVVGMVLLLAAGAMATWVIARRVEARYPPLGRFVDVAGGRLHLIDIRPNNRPPLATILLLHGASASSADPVMALGRRLSERYRVIVPDRPGHGWSDRIGGAEAASPARQAAVIREALDKLDVERAIVVGHSWSGALATNFALDHADLVAGLLLIAPVSHPWPNAAIAWYYRPAAASWLGWLLTRTLAAPAGLLGIGPGITAVFAPQQAPPNYREEARVPLLVRPAAFQANAEDVAGLYAFVTDQSRRYGAIRTPTVIVSGEADTIVWTHLHSRSLERDIPGAKLILLPGVGHMPHHAAADVMVSQIDALAERAKASLP